MSATASVHKSRINNGRSFFSSLSSGPAFNKKCVEKIAEAPSIVIDTRYPTMDTKSCPNIIKATYKDDLNIIKIHETISHVFSWDKVNLKNTEIYKRDAIKKRQIAISINEKRHLDEYITDLNTKIEDVTTERKWNNYITRAKPILDLYTQLASKESKGIVVLKKSTTVTEDPELIQKRLDIIEQYLRLASEYIEMNIMHVQDTTARCPCCDSEFSDDFNEDEDGVYTCKCGYTREMFSKAPQYKDSSRLNVNSSNNYQDKMNFVKFIERFTGTYKNISIPECIYDLLDGYLMKFGHPSGEDIRKLPSDSKGEKPGTNVEMLRQALSAIGYSEHYDDINLIAKNYWGWDLPTEILDYRERILFDYDITQEVYYSIPEEERCRDASLNTQFRLLVHLLALDIPVRRNRFKLPSDRRSIENQQRLWKLMCAGAEDNGYKIKFVEVI